MALLVNQNISSDRPMMLKDFLRDDNYYPYSCKSTAFSKSNKPPAPAVVLLKSWSKKAAASKISAVHKVINAVKLLQFVKSPFMTILPRSNSRQPGKGENDISGGHVIMSEEGNKVKVKVKDILRWRSFRDTVADEDCYNRATTTTTTTTTSSCSKRSSWCDSDFTAEEEELPFWGGENEEGILGKKCFVGTNAASLRNIKGDWLVEECEQQSPVSVFDSPFDQEVIRESMISPLIHPTAANFEKARCILARIIQELEGTTKSKQTRKYSKGEIAISNGVNNVEEKAKQLLSHVKEELDNDNDHFVIYDFFMHELSINGKLHDVGFDNEILRIAKSWIDGECDESYEWEVENTRAAYVKDMEKGVSWNKFGQEQEEMSVDLEVMVLNELIDDALVDLLT